MHSIINWAIFGIILEIQKFWFLHYIIYCVGTKSPGHRMSRHRMSRPGHRMSMPGHKIVDTFFVLFYWAQNVPRHKMSQAQDRKLGTRSPGHKISQAQNLSFGHRTSGHRIGGSKSRAQNIWAQNQAHSIT